MQINLQGKRALVGGSSKGLGRAVATQLAASGASVTLMARSEKLMQECIAALNHTQGQDHHYLVVDFLDFETYTQKLTPYIKANPINILVNNTQGPPPGMALNLKVSDYQSAFDLLFKTVVWTCEQVLPSMQKQQWGRIINVASISVKEPLPYLALSNSIRAALVTWAKTLSRDVAPIGVTVNNILTGYFDTERIAQLNTQKAHTQNIKPEAVRAQMEEQVPMKRMGDPAEYGNLVCFLASSQAAYITGINLPIDGGLLQSL